MMCQWSVSIGLNGVRIGLWQQGVAIWYIKKGVGGMCVIRTRWWYISKQRKEVTVRTGNMVYQ